MNSWQLVSLFKSFRVLPAVSHNMLGLCDLYDAGDHAPRAGLVESAFSREILLTPVTFGGPPRIAPT